MFKYFNKCLFCLKRAKDRRNICASCYQNLPWMEGHCCCVCLAELDSENQETCGDCISSPKYFDQLVTPLEYRDQIHQSIVSFKFKQQLIQGRLLADCWLENYEATIKPELILPVPLHRFRQIRRGFNQSAEIAKHWSKHLDIPYSSKHLKRKNHTQTQRSLKRVGRLKNLRGAFEITDSNLPKHIAIVDDVFTTGSTVNEVAKQIRRCSAVKTVEVWSLAKRQS